MQSGRTRARLGLMGAVLGGSLFASACADDPGELDPDIVHGLARRPGDAVGLDRSGSYDAEITLVSCECPAELAGLVILTPCQATLAGDSYAVGVEMVQADGLLLVRFEDESVTGGLNLDGTFTVGAVFDLSSALASIQYVTRIDGAFDPDSLSGKFDGTLRRHLKGDAVDVLEEPRRTVDCGEHYEFTGRRTF